MVLITLVMHDDWASLHEELTRLKQDDPDQLARVTSALAGVAAIAIQKWASHDSTLSAESIVQQFALMIAEGEEGGSDN